MASLFLPWDHPDTEDWRTPIMPFDNVPMKTPLSRETLSDIRVLRHARERIEYGAWCQGDFEKVWNRCVVGWLRFIACDNDRSDMIASVYLAPALPPSAIFNPTIAKFSNSVRDSAAKVMVYNDLPSTSRADIIDLIDRAIAMVEGT